MEKHLRKILQEVNTIIIPGLGALTVTNQKTMEIMFMPYLKYDDGKLSTFISEQEGISSEMAKALILKSIESIQSTIDDGKSFEVKGLGVFSEDSTGDIVFTSSGLIAEIEEIDEVMEEKVSFPIDEEVKVEEVIVEEVIVEEVVPDEIELVFEEPEIVEEPVLEDVEVQVVEEVVVVEVEVVEETVVVFESTDNEVVVGESVDSELVDGELVDGDLSEETVSEVVSEDLDIEEDDTEVFEEVLVKTKKKRGAKFWIFATLLLLLVSGGTYVGLNYDHFKQFNPLSSKTDTLEVVEEEMLIEKLESDHTQPKVSKTDKKEAMIHSPAEKKEKAPPVIEKESIPEPIPVVASTPQKVEASTAPRSVKKRKATSKVVKLNHSGKGDRNTHLILGTFSEKVNAEGMIDKLSSQGYTTATVLERDGKFSVSLDAFTSKEEAISNLEKAKSVFPKIWVFQK